MQSNVDSFVKILYCYVYFKIPDYHWVKWHDLNLTVKTVYKSNLLSYNLIHKLIERLIARVANVGLREELISL